MMGDPFQEIEIKNGILLITQAGGSSWKWGHTDKYRFQHNRFELIGFSGNYGKNCEYWTDVDYNLATGKIVITKEYEQCDDSGDMLKVYKKENETFTKKLTETIHLGNRNQAEVKIVSPKYRHEIYL
jgi:nuclear transport factor 2 (NTF2) superfamily protein